MAYRSCWPHRAVVAVACAMVLVGPVNPVRAVEPDVVAYLPSGFGTNQVDLWVPRPLTTVRGEIRSFDVQSLEILPAGAAAPERIATRRIVWLRTGWDEASALQGITAYQQGRYAESLAPLLAAAQQRPATWRQQWLLATLASAAFETGRHAAAFELVAQLDRSDLPAPLLDLIPIGYTAITTRQASDAARPMLASPEPLVRLLAASVLLSGADAAAAGGVLEQLAVQSDRPLVAQLAEAVLWRRTPPPAVAAAAEDWWAKIDRLPPSIAGGPMVVVAERLEAAGLDEQALEAWLAVERLGSVGPRTTLARQRSEALAPPAP